MNPEGFGRNMSLFLVMKRYDCSLKEFLEQNRSSMEWKTSLKLLTQLLEGVTHLNHQGIAHRDLKTDNLLLDLSGGVKNPALVIADFGCCFVGESGSLRMKYPSPDISLGGNMALMAPEVRFAKPGSFTVVNYSKADIWAVGAIAYEIFGSKNPFYAQGKGLSKKAINKSNYDPYLDLSDLATDDAPPILTALVKELLHPNPTQRMSSVLASNICQLLLWAPRKWFMDSEYRPNNHDLMQWFVTMTTKLMCETRFLNKGKDLLEYQMVATFLSRLSLGQIKEAISWMRDNY